MKVPRLCLALLVAGLMLSPAAVLAQRGGGHGGGGRGGGGGHGGGMGRGGGYGGGHYSGPSHSYAPRPGYAPSYRYSAPAARPATGTTSITRPRTTFPAPRAQGSISPARGSVDARRFGSVEWGSRFDGAIHRFHRPWLAHHRGWYFGAWNNWWWYPGFWAALPGGDFLSPWASGSSYSYYNPYCVPGPDVLDMEMPPMVPDYSSPIPVPSESDPSGTDEKTLADAMARFTSGRAEFKKGRFAEAAAEVNRAIRLAPGDRSMHEFRALTLFAQKKYDEAAATAYAVLAQGPGWNWNTMSALYDKPQSYTDQLRALEAYVGEHPKNGAVHFLLAYHYLVLDERQKAVGELRAAAKLTPKDKLSALLADALEKMPPKSGEE